MAIKLSRAEMETHIRWDATESHAHICTNDPATIRKLDKLVAEYPDVYVGFKGDYNKRYLVPLKFIRFAKPASEARREAGRRLAKARHAQNEKEE